MEALQELKEEREFTAEEKAYQNFQKFRKSEIKDRDYKAELCVALDQKYKSIK